MHCIDKHQFPKNFDFFIINDGIDHRNSMLRTTPQRRPSTHNPIASSPGRQREPLINTAGDTMDIAYDKVDDQRKRVETLDRERDCSAKPSYIKLRGRGGFSHPQGAGQGRGSQDQGAPVSRNSETAGSVDSLTLSMSALQFVPQSVRMARGKGRGRRL